jgi:TRAP-type C4-dicarboxylate transport system substrate-binding protein
MLSRFMAGMLVAAIAVSLAACTSPAAEPLVLRIATDDGSERPAGLQILHFAEEVAKRSDGLITIEPQWKAAGDLEHDWDQANAQLVETGKMELGLIPARTWDTEGVSTLRALTTPFLITSDDAMNDVAESDLVPELLEGLSGAGVVGIDLFPEGMRHPFGFKAPLLTADDFAGAVIRLPHSATGYATYEALGATPVDDEPDPATQRGLESSYRLAPAGIGTGNVVVSAKFNVLVMNAESEAALTPEQRKILAAAAAATKTWVVETFPSDAEAAETFCSEGGEIALANEDDVAVLAENAAPVRTSLEADVATKSLISAIEDITAAAEPNDQAVACNADTVSPADIDQFDGSYTVEVTADQLNPADVDGTIGSYNTTLEGGHWSLTQVTPDGSFDSTGDYTYIKGIFTWFWGHEPNGYSAMNVVINDDGSLTFSNVHDPTPKFQRTDEAIFSTWTRTG